MHTQRAGKYAADTVLQVSRPAALFLADCITFAIAVITGVMIAMLFRLYLVGEPRPPVESDISRILIVFGVAFIILVFRSVTLGHYTQFRPFWLELNEVIKTVLLIAAFDAFLLFAIGVQFSRLWFGFFLLLLCMLIPYGRERTKIWMIKKGLWYQSTYIVGTGTNAIKTAHALKSDTSLGHKVEGFISTQSTSVSTKKIDDIEVYSDMEHAKLHAKKSATLVFAFETMEEMEKKRDLLNKAISDSSQVLIVPPEMNLPLFGASVVGIFRHDTAILKLQNRLADPSAQFIKRTVDIVLGTFFLALFSPVFLILSLMIKRDGGPVFFNHERIGKNGRHFACHKFRTMRVDSKEMLKQHLENDSAARSNWESKRKLVNDPRVTNIGRYLRKTSVDELPQLVNVIRGDMSLVGPRPIVQEETHHYSSYLSYYLTMTPGMSGLWQVSGRTDTTYEERVRLDVWYCKNWTLWIDVVVLIKTCKTLLLRHGAH